MKMLIKNGHVIDPSENLDEKLDVLVDDGKISDLLKPGSNSPKDAEVIDAGGKLVVPGLIDIHVHLREPGFEYKETIETGCRAAAAGGFTSVACMANTDPVNDNGQVTEFILRRSKEAGYANVFPMGAITKGLKGESLAEFGELCDAGVVAVSDDGKYVDNSELMRIALEYSLRFALTVTSHALETSLSRGGHMHEGIVSTELGIKGIPSEAEEIAIARDISLAKLTGGKLHIAHISTATGVDMVRQAKKSGINVTAEATPHHFTITHEIVRGYDTNTKMCPPLRTQDDVDAIIEGLADGTIDAIATDHAPHAALEKEVEYDKALNGIVGLETAVGLTMKLVQSKKLNLVDAIARLTCGPANVYNLEKGTLKKGADADITIIDPDAQYEVEPKGFKSKSRNTPFAGMELKGKATLTILAGKVVQP